MVLALDFTLGIYLKEILKMKNKYKDHGSYP